MNKPMGFRLKEGEWDTNRHSRVFIITTAEDMEYILPNVWMVQTGIHGKDWFIPAL